MPAPYGQETEQSQTVVAPLPDLLLAIWHRIEGASQLCATAQHKQPTVLQRPVDGVLQKGQRFGVQGIDALGCKVDGGVGGESVARLSTDLESLVVSFSLRRVGFSVSSNFSRALEIPCTNAPA